MDSPLLLLVPQKQGEIKIYVCKWHEEENVFFEHDAATDEIDALRRGTTSDRIQNAVSSNRSNCLQHSETP